MQSVINDLNRKVENNFSEEQSSIILKQTSILVNSNDFWHYFNSKIKEASDSTSALNKTCIPPGGTPAGYPPNIEPQMWRILANKIESALNSTQIDNIAFTDATTGISTGLASFYNSGSLQGSAIAGALVGAGSSAAYSWNLVF